MEGPGGNPPRRRAGDANTPYGAPSVRDWQRNTWFGPAPQATNPFDEPESAPELLELRSENVKEKAGEFWQEQTATGYQPAFRTAGKHKAASGTAQKEKPKKRSRVVLWTALILLLAAGATAAILYFGVYMVKEIRVEGNARISEADIIRFSGIRKNTPVFALNEQEISDQIRTNIVKYGNSNPNYYLLQFRYMDRQMPGTVILAVKEWEPCCWVDLRGITYVMDKKRFVVYETENESERDRIMLVQVKGLKVRSGSKEGQTMILESAVQQHAFEEIFLEMKVLGCTDRIQEVDLSNPSSVLMVTREGYTVNLGNCASADSAANRIHAKLRSLMLVQEELVRIGEKGGSIDVAKPEEPRYSRGKQ